MRVPSLLSPRASASFFARVPYLARPSSGLVPLGARSISFSSGSSSSHGSGSSRIKPVLRDSAAQSPRPSPSSTGAASSPPPVIVTATKPATPLASSLPHANANLILNDGFFALHRPLLELPIRLSARKTVAPLPRLWSPAAEEDIDDRRAAELERDDIEAFGREAVVHELESEIVQMVELAPDGVTPVGPPFMATLSGGETVEQARAAEEEEVYLDEMDREATEAAMDDIENGLPDPYDAWLIGTHDADLPSSPAVSKYLAAHPPFSPPLAPSPRTASRSSSAKTAATASYAAQTLSDISFLRPFPPATVSPSLYSTNPAFATHFLDPLPSGVSARVADDFLAASILSHRYLAHGDYARTAGEALELARQSYAPASDPPAVPRRAFDEKRQRGEVRLWSEEKGWVTVNFGRGVGGGSPFLPAEMVDLDWEDEQAAAMMEGVRMDSVKRKRKKKITKHKFKKRRKAQQALRQRLGK